ncbi:MAG: Xaa-Pro peptidase family protein [Desulfobacterales bacterium]
MEYLPDKNIPKYEIDNRLNKFQSQMKKSGIEAALIIHNMDLYYFSGTIQQAHLFVPSQGEAILMASKDFNRARSESPLERVIFLKSSKEISSVLKENGYSIPERLGMELDVIPANHFFGYQKIFKNSQIVDISPLIRYIRAVKSLFEIDKIKKAAQLADEVFGTVKNHLRAGLTEVDFAGKIESEARKRGHQGIVRMRMWGGELFYGHIMTGASAAAPSFLASPTGGSGVSPAIAQGAGFKKIVPNEPVLIDYAFVHDGYISDQTRIFCLGIISPHLIQAHQIMLELQQKIKMAALPGITGGEIYDLAIRFVRKHRCENNFMGTGERRIRFVGHGVGLELDEYPFLAKGQTLALEEGMVLALEPKLIYPGQGVVGVENTHLVTKNGLKQLGKFQEDIVFLEK